MDPQSNESSDVLLGSQGRMGTEEALFMGCCRGRRAYDSLEASTLGGWLGAGESKTLGHGTLWKLRRGIARFLQPSLWFKGANAGNQVNNNGKRWGDVDRFLRCCSNRPDT